MTPYRFFYQNAGYSYDPKTETREAGRRRCARESAAAEKAAKARGILFAWEPDREPYQMGDAETEPPKEVYACVAYAEDGKSVLASLCGIGDPSPEYRRVVEAELALEALAHHSAD